MPQSPEHEGSVAIGLLQAGVRASDVASQYKRSNQPYIALEVVTRFLQHLNRVIFIEPCRKCSRQFLTNVVLSNSNPRFQCNVAITNFLLSHTFEIRFRDAIDRTLHMFTS